MHVSILVAVAENGVIGRAGALPWRLSADLRRFRQLTMGHTIVMGRKTWESIGRALPGRQTVVVSRQTDYQANVEGVVVVHDLASALQRAESRDDEEAYIVGGAELYRIALEHADRLYLTRVHAVIEGDTYMPEIDLSQWRLEHTERHEADVENDHPFTFQRYHRVREIG